MIGDVMRHLSQARVASISFSYFGSGHPTPAMAVRLARTPSAMLFGAVVGVVAQPAQHSRAEISAKVPHLESLQLLRTPDIFCRKCSSQSKSKFDARMVARTGWENLQA